MNAIEDPRTDAEWLHDMFEYECCEICGLDEDAHFVGRDILGLRLVFCRLPWQSHKAGRLL